MKYRSSVCVCVLARFNLSIHIYIEAFASFGPKITFIWSWSLKRNIHTHLSIHTPKHTQWIYCKLQVHNNTKKIREQIEIRSKKNDAVAPNDAGVFCCCICVNLITIKATNRFEIEWHREFIICVEQFRKKEKWKGPSSWLKQW